MEKLAKLLSIAVAACFICSATYLYGELSALHRLDIVPYLTFADFVNFTPTILLINGLSFTIWLLNDRRIKSGLEKTRSHPKGSVFLLLLLAGLLLFVLAIAVFASSGWQTVLFMGIAGVVLTTLSTKGNAAADTAFGQGAGEVLDGFLALIFISLVFGYEISPAANRQNPPTFVCTKAGEEVGTMTIPLDRGLALIQDNGFRLIPWGEIKTVSTISTKVIKAAKLMVPRASGDCTAEGQ